LKKGVFIIALALIAAQSSVILLILKGNISLQQFMTQMKIYHSESEKIPTDTLLINPDKVRWEHEKEFWLEGKLYDVISKKSKGDLMEVIAYRDIPEERAHKNYRFYTHSSHNQVLQASPPSLNPKINLLYCRFEESDAVLNKPFRLVTTNYQFAVKECILSQESPPPNLSA